LHFKSPAVVWMMAVGGPVVAVVFRDDFAGAELFWAASPRAATAIINKAKKERRSMDVSSKNARDY